HDLFGLPKSIANLHGSYGKGMRLCRVSIKEWKLIIHQICLNMFIRPLNSPDFVENHLKSAEWFIGQKNLIKDRLAKFCASEPQVSVVIPAYNEEAHILRTLSSLSFSVTHQAVEIIVVDNNSNN